MYQAAARPGAPRPWRVRAARQAAPVCVPVCLQICVSMCLPRQAQGRRPADRQAGGRSEEAQSLFGWARWMGQRAQKATVRDDGQRSVRCVEGHGDRPRGVDTIQGCRENRPIC